MLAAPTTTKFTYIARLFQSSLVILLVVNLQNQWGDACFASGICGGGGIWEIIILGFKNFD